MHFCSNEYYDYYFSNINFASLDSVDYNANNSDFSENLNNITLDNSVDYKIIVDYNNSASLDLYSDAEKTAIINYLNSNNAYFIHAFNTNTNEDVY